MSSRDRKRADRRKRKHRSTQGEDAHLPEGKGGPEDLEAAPGGGDQSTLEGDEPANEAPLDLAAEAERLGVSKSELKNQRAREQLEPLEEDERPRAVTVGAILSGLIALITVGAWILGAEADGQRPGVIQVLAPAILFGVMAWGMWGKRYWAVLGFQAVLAIIMVGAFITLVAATNVAQALTAVVVLVAAGVLFWFMIKAMARIQMPEGPS